jgi:hypothetical protein
MKKLLVLVFVATMSMACGKKAANTTPQPDSQMEGAGEKPEGDPCGGATDPCAGGDPCGGGGADPCGGN